MDHHSSNDIKQDRNTGEEKGIAGRTLKEVHDTCVGCNDCDVEVGSPWRPDG